MKKENKLAVELKPKYLACIWCGKENKRKYAQYCSEKCKRKTLGKSYETKNK